MKATKITRVYARQIIDSRGNPKNRRRTRQRRSVCGNESVSYKEQMK